MKRVLPAFAVLLACGCMPSKEAKTAGQIGCPRSQIKILSEDTERGWGSSTLTWTAECRGKTFICSENIVSSSGRDGSGGVSSQVSCSPSLDGSASSDNTQSPVATQGAAAPRAASGPPIAAAGFDLGSASAVAQAACERAGKTWTSEAASFGRCSGPAVDMGFPAEIEIVFTGDRATTITIVHTPVSDWIARLRGFKSTLVKKYGKERRRNVDLPRSCLPDAAFMDCVKNGTAKMQYVWSWDSGDRILLAAGRKRGSEGEAVIILRYEGPSASISGAGL